MFQQTKQLRDQKGKRLAIRTRRYRVAGAAGCVRPPSAFDKVKAGDAVRWVSRTRAGQDVCGVVVDVFASTAGMRGIHVCDGAGTHRLWEGDGVLTIVAAPPTVVKGA